MASSRRAFLAGTISLTASSMMFLHPKRAAAGEEKMANTDEEPTFELRPVGRVEKSEGSARIRIFEQYADALKGLSDWSHINVLYWFDKNDTPQKRGILQVHPRGNPENPLTGVFACRSPVRPNLIALSVCRIASIKENVIHLDDIDAFDATPVLDIKPVVPGDALAENIQIPDWANKKKGQ